MKRLPAIALHAVKLAAVRRFGWASVRISGTDAAGLVRVVFELRVRQPFSCLLRRVKRASGAGRR